MKIMKIAKRIFLALFVLSLIALYVIIYAIPGVTGAFTQTETLVYGNFRVEENVTVYFVRNEQVYMATRAGNINYYIGDGVHVKAGTRILNVIHGTQDEDEVSAFANIIERLGDSGVKLTDFVSESNGIVSFFIDGFENYFTPENMRQLRYSTVSSLDTTPVNVVRERTIVGEPLFKVSENRQWYIICWVQAGSVARYERGRNVTIELPQGHVRAEIADIIEDGDRWLIIFSTNRFYEDFARIRSAEATVVTSNFNGIIVRNEDITVRGGVIGVYVRTRSGSFAFRPIQIITSDGENSLAEVSFFYDSEGNRVSTVNVHDEILRRPPAEAGDEL